MIKTVFYKKLLYALKNPRTWIFTLLYIAVAVFLEDRPDEMLLYLLPEGITIMSIGMFYELYVATSVSKAMGRFLVYAILISLTIFLLLFPFSFTIFLNSSVLPELNLFYSEDADKIFVYLSQNNSIWGLFEMPLALFGKTALIIVGVTVVNFLPIKRQEGSIFIGEGHVPYELKYVCFMTLGFLIGALPAFLIGMFIQGSFPFVLVIAMRLYTEIMLSPNASK